MRTCAQTGLLAARLCVRVDQQEVCSRLLLNYTPRRRRAQAAGQSARGWCSARVQRASSIYRPDQARWRWRAAQNALDKLRSGCSDAGDGAEQRHDCRQCLLPASCGATASLADAAGRAHLLVTAVCCCGAARRPPPPEQHRKQQWRPALSASCLVACWAGARDATGRWG